MLWTSKSVLVAAGVLTAILLAAACGDDDDSTQTPAGSASEEPSPTPDESAQANGSLTPTPAPADTDAAIELIEFSVGPLRTSALPGTVTFHVRNVGEITHQFLVIRTDLPHAQLPRLEDGSGADESQLDIVGRIDEIEPGDEEQTTIDVESGNYVLICNLASDGVSHYLSGMYDRFTVSDTAAPPDDATE